MGVPMNEKDLRSRIRGALLEALIEVAPEADFDSIDPERPLRDQVELDSMDLLNFWTRIKRKTGVEIQAHESDRARTLAGLSGILRERM
jgi:acyl carrier protein